MMNLLTEVDLEWVEGIVDVVEKNARKPWRVALERFDDLKRATPRADIRRFDAVVGAVQRLCGGGLRNTKIARRARGLVLGHPVFTAEHRGERIAHAALMLGTTPAEVETLLWCDLPRERPIELPDGRPSELEAAAFANIALLQRAVRRAQSIVLTVSDGDPGLLVRAAADRGLLVYSARDTLGATIELVGPLALCKGTTVYGRALADLVPLLGELREWAMEIKVELPLASYSTHVACGPDSPVLLPTPPTRLMATPFPILRLTRGLARLERSLGLLPLPPPLVVGAERAAPADSALEGELVWPDLAIDDHGRRIYVELVGFWTRSHLDHKLALYRALGADVILCVDTARSTELEVGELPPQALGYTKLVPIEALLARLRPA